MKPIVLTKEHESKLLEMCNELFMFDFEIIKNNIKIFNIEGTHYTTIHWFEFCMTHLRIKLTLHHDDMYGTTNPGGSTFKHPVDYLYEEFKKRLMSKQ